MLHINDLTYRIEGRVIFDQATAGIPAGHKVGLVGRNGSGKTTLLRLIAGEIAPDDGAIRIPRSTRIGCGGAGGAGRARKPDRLRAGRRHGAGASCWPRRRPRKTRPASPTSTSGSPTSTRTPPPPGPRASWPGSASTRRPSSAPAASTRAAGACGWRWRPCCSPSPTCCCSTSPPTISTSRARCGSRSTSRDYPHTVLIVSHDRDLLNRSVGAILHLSAGQAHALHGRLRPVRGGAAREAAPRPQAQEEAGRRAPPHRGLHRPLQGQGHQGRAGAEPRQGAGAHAADRRGDRGADRPVPVRQSGEGASRAR